MLRYAGIGSRNTPEHICELMSNIGEKLANNKWLLRSGHARGTDKAFERGCDASKGKKEIFTKHHVTESALELAEQFHPAWHNCDDYAKSLHARNCFIILGNDLDTPVNIVLCYAPGEFNWGGTSQGLRIARHYNIPILNMFHENIYRNLKDTYDQK